MKARLESVKYDRSVYSINCEESIPTILPKTEGKRVIFWSSRSLHESSLTSHKDCVHNASYGVPIVRLWEPITRTKLIDTT